jgi:hypothetical protein
MNIFIWRPGGGEWVKNEKRGTHLERSQPEPGPGPGARGRIYLYKKYKYLNKKDKKYKYKESLPAAKHPTPQ